MWQNDEFKRLVAKFDIRNSLFAIVMSDLAIRVEKLGKLYRIGRREPYSTLRDVLARSFAAPFRYLRQISNFEFRNANLSNSRLGNSQFAIPNPQFAIRNPQSEYIWALKDASFEIKRGEVVGIIGRNGAGKSTLLKILSRITEPTTGRARVRGRVGALLEVGTGFHPELTGRENVYLNGAILGMKKAEIDRKFDEIVAFAEVEKFLDTPVKHYSSGMYTRLAFAVAAHLEPEILLVDEVLAVGDVAFQKKCLGKMGEVAKRGRTVLFVSHQMFAIRTLCERALWLDQGRLVKQGPALEVVQKYEETLLREAYADSTAVERRSEVVRGLDFYIQRVEMHNSQTGERTNVIGYSQSLGLLVHLAGECPAKEYSIEFRIYKDSGEFACTGVSGLLHGIYFDRGTTKVRIEIGPVILTSGGYTVSFRVSAGLRNLDSWDQACSFHVVGCHPFALPREIKTPVCVVQHTFSPLE